MTNEQPPAQDKLAEIEQTIAEFGGGGEGTYIRWLIEEVKRLRAENEQLLATASQRPAREAPHAMSPLIGSILVVGNSRQSGGTFPCDLCHREVNRAWTIRCALAGCERQHSICGLCLTAIQRFACANPAAADARLKAAADRATPKEQP